MKDKLLHIVGGGYNQVPLVKIAKELGLKILVTDMYENPPCRIYADFYERIDTTDKEKTLLAAEKHQVDAVVTDQTDVAVPTVAYIAEELGLEGIGYETSLRFTNKYLMREALKKAIPKHIPDYHYFNTAESAIDFCSQKQMFEHFIVKPINSQGSKGVYKLNTANDANVISRAFVESKNRGILIEQFVEGFEYSVEGYKQNEEYYNLAVTKKYHYKSNDCIDERNTYLGDIAPELEQSLFDLNKKVVQLLGLPFGITHAEYKMNDGKPYLMEIAARGGGGSISSKIIPYLTGFEPARALLYRIFKKKFKIEIEDYKKKFAVLKFFNLKPGKVKNIYYDREITKNLLEFNLEIKPGGMIKEIKDSRDRPGYFVVAETQRLHVIEKEKQVEASLQIEYE